ncbi:3-hydroxybutyryl-CoA dehydrogenase [Halovenus aranensis]|jgi:3-hydroxybutyryl-CoA dehydrogenase|uniref:3-hydroxybutyryl-CoA dehydrogenase n=1 Tax=Halovenus aranensis TaxID=890420 RepID=A0A1G8RZE1_9EURY|nr:3-hydroxyacyl-CoA dehydrogenase family protein [Halovenus aranensis]SDJ22337.1 3-hydroxybutyryl-CoA dehydrogenase [Halovenus aranensis]
MNIAVLGADATAREVAAACVRAGERVNLHAGEVTAVMDSIDTVERRLGTDGIEASDRIEGTTGLDAAVADADIVVDTTRSDAAALQDRFAELEEEIAEETLVASAVPAVSVTSAAAGLRRPGRAVGFRFHQPPEPFVEVVLAEQTEAVAADRASQFAERVATDWIAVRDTPGNVSARLALSLEVVAVRMVDEGVADVTAVDTAFEHLYQGEIGPLERADRLGLDQRHEALRSLAERLGPRFEPPPLLTALVEADKTGLDAGEGFYVWEGETPQHSALADPTAPEDHRDLTG